LSTALPVLLILSAWQTYRSMEDQKEVYLRSRVAALAARLETFPPASGSEAEALETLTEEEPGLAGLAIHDQPSPELAALWNGQELFRVERTPRLYRAYIPFHRDGRIQVARIDLDSAAADFLVEHAQHHLFLVVLVGVLIVVLSVMTARAWRRQLELEHLAQIGKMSAALAHEIRNPLGTIKGYAQLLAEQGREEQQSFLKPILDEASRLEQLVKDLLAYGRPAHPHLSAVESQRLVELMQVHARRYAAQVELRTDVSPFVLQTDLSLLEQILLNLLRNAAEVAGVIRFEVQADGRDAVLRVVDNGPGLSTEAERRMFEPFFTSKASGTGLGLCISQKLAAALGGTLRVANVASGHGVIAEVRLPLAGM
jgi:signal transduction histidine kinase